MLNMQINDLGKETVFHIVINQISVANRSKFENKLYNLALGFTRNAAVGGWRNESETILVYRVANLTQAQRDELITWLLVNTAMTDLYVVYPDSIARGHRLEPDGKPTTAPQFPTKPATQEEAYTRSINREERNPNSPR